MFFAAAAVDEERVNEPAVKVDVALPSSTPFVAMPPFDPVGRWFSGNIGFQHFFLRVEQRHVARTPCAGTATKIKYRHSCVPRRSGGCALFGR